MGPITSFADLLALLHAERRLLEGLLAQPHLPVREPAALLLARIPHDPERVQGLLDLGLLIRTGQHLTLAPPLLALAGSALEDDSRDERGLAPVFLAGLERHLLAYQGAEAGPGRAACLRQVQASLVALAWQLPRDLEARAQCLPRIAATQSPSAGHRAAAAACLSWQLEAQELIDTLREWLRTHILFRLPPSDELDQQVLALREALPDLAERGQALAARLRLFLATGTAGDRPLAKVARLKQLKDQGRLRSLSNLEALFDTPQAIALAGRSPAASRLSLDLLPGDAGREALQRLQRRRPPASSPAAPPPVVPLALRSPTIAPDTSADLAGLFAAFCQSGQDLMTFLVHDGARTHRDLATNSQLYCQLIGLYAAQMAWGEQCVQYEGRAFLAVWPRAGQAAGA